MFKICYILKLLTSFSSHVEVLHVKKTKPYNKMRHSAQNILMFIFWSEKFVFYVYSEDRETRILNVVTGIDPFTRL